MLPPTPFESWRFQLGCYGRWNCGSEKVSHVLDDDKVKMRWAVEKDARRKEGREDVDERIVVIDVAAIHYHYHQLLLFIIIIITVISWMCVCVFFNNGCNIVLRQGSHYYHRPMCCNKVINATVAPASAAVIVLLNSSMHTQTQAALIHTHTITSYGHHCYRLT